MKFSEEQFKYYRNYSLSFLETTKSCIPVLTDTGKFIQDFYKGVDVPRSIIFCHDIIKRVRENLFCLTIYPPQEDNSVPLRLILRCVFGDLIWCTFVVANLGNDEVLKPFLDFNDLSAVVGKKSFAESEIGFFKLCGNDNYIEYFNPKIEDLSKTHDEILLPYGSKSKLRKLTKTTTADIAEYFLTNEELKDLYPVLYGPFKMLSQVEHYANENRSYSYFSESTAFFFSRFAISYKIAIDCLCSEIKSFISK